MVSLSLLLLSLIHSSIAAAQRPAECATSVPDSLWTRSAPVYRDCEVDKAAARRGKDPTLDFDPFELRIPPGCIRVKLEFVVDTTGKVEPATLRVVSSDNAKLTAAVSETAVKFKYTPAELNQAKVRQVVRYERSVAIPAFESARVPFSSSRGGPPLAEGPRPTLRSC